MSIEYLRALLDADPADIAFPLSLDLDAKRAADAAQIDLEALTEYRARLLAALPEERAAEGVVQSYADLSPTAGLDRDIAAAQQRVDETRDAARRVTIVLLFRQLPTRGEGSFQELAAEMAARDGGFDAVAVEEACAIDVLGDERLRPDEFADDAGNPNEVEAGEVLADEARHLGLVDEVEFGGDLGGHFIDDGAVVKVRLAPGDEADDGAEVAEVKADEVADLGVLDLHDHVAAVVEGGAVDLGERGGAEGRVIEPGEEFADGLSELLFDDGADLRRRPWRDLILEAGETAHVGLGGDIGAGADELAHLDVEAP